MGVKGAHRLIKSERVPYDVVSLSKFAEKWSSQTIFFDLLGSLFYQIKKAQVNDKRWLNPTLLNFLTRPNVVVVLEGQRSRLKLATAISRVQITQQQLAKFASYLEKAASTRTLGKKHWRLLESLHISGHPLNIPDITRTLSDHGILWIAAEFEADLYIAHQRNSIVVSRDSDFMFHRNVNCFAKYLPGRESVVVFRTADIARTLGIPPEFLPVLAVLSGTDYNGNIANVGIVAALKFLKIQKLGIANTQELFENFIASKKISKKKDVLQEFLKGFKVFGELQETPLNPPESILYNDAVQRNQRTYLALKQKFRNLKDIKPEPAYIQTDRSNLFRPKTEKRYRPRRVMARTRDAHWTSINFRTFNPFEALAEEIPPNEGPQKKVQLVLTVEKKE